MTDSGYVGKLLYPRLPPAPARKQLVYLKGLGFDELPATSDLQHSAAAPAPVGGHPASEHQLAEVRTAIRAVAQQFGYPNPLAARDQAAHDRHLATVLFQTMDIVTGDAASPEVWSFMTLVLVPELAFWRFGEAADERYFGGLRNTLQRLWWRAWTLGPDLTVVPEGATPFGEDDFVQLMERPTVSGNERLARAFYDIVLTSDLDSLNLTRSELVRRLVVLVRARRSHIAMDALSDQQLRDLVASARSSIQGSPRR